MNKSKNISSVDDLEIKVDEKSQNNKIKYFERDDERTKSSGYSFSIVGVMDTYYYRTTSQTQ